MCEQNYLEAYPDPKPNPYSSLIDRCYGRIEAAEAEALLDSLPKATKEALGVEVLHGLARSFLEVILNLES